MSDFLDSHGLSRSAWIRGLIAAAINYEGNTEATKYAEQRTRYQRADAAMLMAAQKRIAEAREKRKTFRGRRKITEEEAAAKRAKRRERSMRNMKVQGYFPLSIVSAIFREVERIEESEKKSMSSERFTRLVKEVVMRLDAEDARKAGEDRGGVASVA